MLKVEFVQFKKNVAAKFGVNLEGYKEKQLKRRIDSLMASLGIRSYADYLKLLKQEDTYLRQFLDRVTINVSEFFRNREIFRQLEEKILPELLSKKKRLNIWSAACSDGSEPYSIAIILNELTPGTKHNILATDMDTKILEIAKQGRYGQNSVRNVSPARLERYFEIREGKFQLKNDIISRVQFKKHDLLADSFGRDYDLIVCRNVTIYFTPETQDELYQKFRKALSDRGALFIGATESILRYHDLGFKKISPWFYCKV